MARPVSVGKPATEITVSHREQDRIHDVSRLFDPLYHLVFRTRLAMLNAQMRLAIFFMFDTIQNSRLCFIA